MTPEEQIKELRDKINYHKADCRSLSASQCADVKSSGCFLKRRGR